MSPSRGTVQSLWHTSQELKGQSGLGRPLPPNNPRCKLTFVTEGTGPEVCAETGVAFKGHVSMLAISEFLKVSSTVETCLEIEQQRTISPPLCSHPSSFPSYPCLYESMVCFSLSVLSLPVPRGFAAGACRGELTMTKCCYWLQRQQSWWLGPSKGQQR